MKTITGLQKNIFLKLYTYRYLTNEILANKLEVGSLQRVREATRFLSKYPSERSPFLSVIKFPPHARFGKFSFFYCLRTNARPILNEMGIDAHDSDFPGNIQVAFTSDYSHRKKFIVFHVQLTQALQSEYGDSIKIDRFERYFQKDGNLFAKTRISNSKGGFIIPDGVFTLDIAGNGKRLFFVEIANGDSRDTRRNINQIIRHDQMIMEKAYEKFLPCIPRILYVFSDYELMSSVIEKLKDTKLDFKKSFLFALGEDLRKDFFGSWIKLENQNWFNAFRNKKEPLYKYYNFLTGKESNFGRFKLAS